MLILQRRAGESIWISDNIQITILGNFKGMTRMGITVSQAIPTVKEELHNREKSHAAITKTY